MKQTGTIPNLMTPILQTVISIQCSSIRHQNLAGDRFAVYRAAMTHQKGLSALSVHEDFFNTMDSNGLEWGALSTRKIGLMDFQWREFGAVSRV